MVRNFLCSHISCTHICKQSLDFEELCAFQSPVLTPSLITSRLSSSRITWPQDSHLTFMSTSAFFCDLVCFPLSESNPKFKLSGLRYYAISSLVALNLLRQNVCHEAFLQRIFAFIPSPLSSFSTEILTGSSPMNRNLIRFFLKTCNPHRRLSFSSLLDTRGTFLSHLDRLYILSSQNWTSERSIWWNWGSLSLHDILKE